MTEEKKTPTLDEITTSFFNKCHCTHDNDYYVDDCRPCDYCKVLHSDYDPKRNWVPWCTGDGDSQGECERHYIYEVATGQRDINKPLWNPPKEELPEWCKVGAWVMDEDDLTLITEIDHAYIWGKVADRDVIMMQPIDRARELKPIRFRPYEYEEAQNLIGKVIVVPEKEGIYGIDLIYSVSYNRELGKVLINGDRFETYSEDGCLIDGLPIGVPVVDEDALKGGEE